MSDPRSMLTIGQLAEYVGVTVRAVRHYHQRGLLPEPERDASGYRRYGALAVLELTRIKILAEAGVPLARISELLEAGPAELAAAVREIDAALREQVAEIEHRRRRIADLAVGTRTLLPPELAGLLDTLQAIGVDDRTLELERDGWLLVLVRYPEQGREWLVRKRADLADPEFQRLYRRFDEARGMDPDDPQLEEIAAEVVRFATTRYDAEEVRSWQPEDPTLRALTSAYKSALSSPGLMRLNELLESAQAVFAGETQADR